MSNQMSNQMSDQTTHRTSIQRNICWGIDLGTTNSELAFMRGDAVITVSSKYQEPTTPSAVYFMRGAEGGVETECGKKAKQRITSKPGRVASEFKQHMGNPQWRFHAQGLDHEESAAQLSGRILRELKSSLQRRDDLPGMVAAVVTVPAAFQNPQFDDTMEAAQLAGIDHVELLPEPVAAALAYGRRSETAHAPVWLAYDLGGGTFDAALVRGEDGLFSILDHEGDRNLGGKNLDNAIIMDLVRPQLPRDLQDRIVPWQTTEWWILKAAAEEAKIALSVDETTVLEATLDGREFGISLTQAQINALQIKVFGRTLHLCRKLLARNEFTPKDIEKVILVGGPSLSPFLRRMIQHGAPDPTGEGGIEGLGIEVDAAVNPLTAVAEGAAIYAAGRLVPRHILARHQEAGDEQARVAVEVSAPAQVREENVLAAGSLTAVGPHAATYDGWAVTFERLDASGNPIWQSEPVGVSADGKFAKRLPLQDGTNPFRIQVLDDRREPVAARGSSFQVLKDIGVGGLTLPRGIGIADESGQTVWFFAKGEGLPTRSSKAFLTTVGVSRRNGGQAIEIPVVEGIHEKASLNNEVYTLRITSDDVHVAIPQGSTVIVTLAISESRAISMTASLEDYEGLDFSSNLGKIVIQKDDVVASLDRLENDLELFERVRDRDSSIDSVLKSIETQGCVAEIRSLLEEGSEANPNPWDSATERILEVKALCDPHYACVNEWLAWLPHETYCNRNIDMAKQIVSETSALPSEWLWKFQNFCKEYEDACQARDQEQAESLAYTALPELFKTNQMLRERVGGGVTEVKDEAEMTSGNAIRTGTVRKA